MEGTLISPPNNSAQLLRLQIKQKSTYIKKRKVKTWSPEQDDQLVKLYDEYPKKWGIIASLMQDRNQNQCLHRYRRLSQLGAHKKIWSAQEDQTILSLIKKVGKNWKLLAEIMGSKTGKQIRQRFINKLDPKIKTQQWTDQEDKLILKYYSEVGSKWSEISKKLPGRPQNKIKNRFYSYIQKNYDIRYIYADQNQMENSKEKGCLPVFFSQRDSQNNNLLSSLQAPITFEDQNKPEPLERAILKQIPENNKNGEKNKNLKITRKIRLRSNYSRFHEHKSEENIYQDENEHSPKPVKIIGKQKNQQNCQMPSIKQLDDQFKIALVDLQPQHNHIFNGSIYQVSEKDEIFDSNAHLGQKYYIKSLIRVQDQLVPLQNKYRSIRDIVSNAEIENHDNELFYLSQH